MYPLPGKSDQIILSLIETYSFIVNKDYTLLVKKRPFNLISGEVKNSYYVIKYNDLSLENTVNQTIKCNTSILVCNTNM